MTRTAEEPPGVINSPTTSTTQIGGRDHFYGTAAVLDERTITVRHGRVTAPSSDTSLNYMLRKSEFPPELNGVRAVADRWTVRDGNGDLLRRFVAGSRQEVARKLARKRYDPFRLEVSSSYREVFERDVKGVLELKDWQIVPLRRRTRARRWNDRQLELELMLN